MFAKKAKTTSSESTNLFALSSNSNSKMYTEETRPVGSAFRGQRAYLAEVGREGFLSFLHGLNLAGGQGLEISLLSLQPGPLSADLPERRLFLWPPSLTDRHLHRQHKNVLNYNFT